MSSLDSQRVEDARRSKWMKGRAVVISFGNTTELRESVQEPVNHNTVGIRLNTFECCSSRWLEGCAIAT